MAYSNKTYVAFDADTDIRYYRLMQAWKHNDGTSFDFYDAHDLNTLMQWSSEETIKDKLQERLRNTKVFILLVGENTKNLYKFVRWEIEQAVKRDIPIIVVNLNGKRSKDSNLCPAILSGELSLHVSYNQKIIEKSQQDWPSLHSAYRSENKISDYYYKNNIYQSFGL